MNPAGLIDLMPAALRQQWKDEGIYPDRAVFRLFAEQARRQPDAPAVLMPGCTVSYAQLDQAARRLAGSFRRMGIVPGDVIACQLPNGWKGCAVDLAAAALGAVVAPFPPGRGRLDLASLLQRCAARAFIVEAFDAETDMCRLVEALRPTLLALRFPIVAGTARRGWQTLDSLLDGPALADDALIEVDADAPVRLLVSSGTESAPKLVAYSHNALIGGRGRFLQRLHPDGADFRGLYLVPLGSSFGSSATFGVLSWLGGSLVLLPRFDVAAAIDAIGALRPTHLFGVPTMFQRMAADPALATMDTSSLRAIVSGGAMVDPETVRRCAQAFGCGFVSLYGSADGVNCHTLPDEPLEVPLRSVGRPNPSVCEIRIVDEHGRRQASGQRGEILARGPLSPMQYVNAPELDARYRCRDGWVRTGDLGFLDPMGYLVLSGRKKDVIIRGGANISPVQIEALATTHPDITGSACMPVPDADLGQRLCLCVTLKEGALRPSLEAVHRHFRRHGLSVDKLPDYLCFFSQLPLGPAGKVDKKQLASAIRFLGSTGRTAA